MVDLGNLVAKRTEIIKLSNSLLGLRFCLRIPNEHHDKKVDMLFILYSRTEVIPPFDSSTGAGAGAGAAIAGAEWGSKFTCVGSEGILL